MLLYLTAETCVLENPRGKESLEQAARYYRTALKQRPTCAPCHRGLARTLLLQGRKGEAQIHVRKAELFEPNRLRP